MTLNNNMNLVSGRMPTVNENRLIPKQLLAEFDDEAICTLRQWTLLPNQPGSLRIFSLIALLAMMVIVVVGGNALIIAAVSF
jgi:hypothetical protein